MVQLNPLNVAALALYTTSAMALPQPIYGPVLEAFGYKPKYAQLKPTKAQGVYPTQPAAPTGTEVVALPTGYYPVPTGGLHPGYPVPTGGFHPGYKQYGLAKRDDKDDEHDDSGKHDEQKKKKHDKHNGSKKHDDKKKKKHRKPQGLAAPTGTGSFPIPTGSVSDEDTLEGTQERQFGAIRQRDFKPHWAGSPSEDEFPEPTGAGVAAPTGTGGLSPGKHGKHGKHEKHEKEGKHGKHEKDGKPEKDGKHGKHEKDEQDEQPAIVARSDDDETSHKKHGEKDVEKDVEKHGEKHGEKHDKSDKKHGEKNDEKHSEKKDKKKAGKKHRKPQGLAPPTGTGGFPMPTGGFSPGVLPAGVSDGTDEGIQKRHFGGVRQHGFKPHWAGSHKGGYPAPTGTSPPSPTGTGHY